MIVVVTIEIPVAESAIFLEKRAIFTPISDGTVLALPKGVEAVKKFATVSVIGVVGHPFMPYMLVLLGLLRAL